MRRVTGRREHPKRIHSHKGTNFIWPERAIKDTLIKLNDTRIINDLNENEIEWVFNIPKSSWMSVAMEALGKFTEECYKTIAKDRPLNEETLRIFLVTLKV